MPLPLHSTRKVRRTNSRPSASAVMRACDSASPHPSVSCHAEEGPHAAAVLPLSISAKLPLLLLLLLLLALLLSLSLLVMKEGGRS